ncbi:DUF896 domain-containing protein [Natranaerobius trueperi]|uniref:UPF0291 protein CDO51_08705 n=1 Tax=Natranaerobius trueperi TaxID=759412 RepID=A0A226BWP0_9FIRM|nr:DUF896 domain-containing protein [Natranaerobius trueperi]OWZ83458.1 hypothetical protein CDO51_08705 [Natranaerobius trueperi]
MISKELVERINTLANKKKEKGLTKEEQEEQTKLRKEYLKAVRQQVINQMGGPPPKDNSHKEDCGCNKNKKHS